MLDFPYKDCILEGGQTKDDQKRAEIFYNEILAPEQVTNLLAPKAFCNAKRYDANGEHKIDSISQNDNLIIKGNNLIALSSLLERYRGKVKCIYIDPPYNTGSAANTFSYNNNFNHSSWLTFMKNRLEMAKKLLREDGTVWVCIDHYELFYLGILLDEIFGRENRLGVITVVTNPGGRQDETFFPTANDFMLVYAKNVNETVLNTLGISETKTKQYSLLDSDGKYKLRGFRRSGNNSLRTQRPGLYYPIYFNPGNNDISLEKKKDYVEILPIDEKGIERCWRWGKESFLEKLEKYITIKSIKGKFDIYVKEREIDYQGEKPKTIWNKSEYTGQTGTNELKKILGEKSFSYPKSHYVIMDVIKVATNENDIILDFFCGSGTTAHAVMELNKNDNGKRQFILCEQMDYIKSVTISRVHEVLKRTSGGSFVYCELASLNASYIERISSCKTESEIVSLIEEILQSDFVSSAVLPSKIDTNADDFKELSFDDKKKFALEILDKNLLYINEADIEDESANHKTLEMSDKEFTRSFYGKDGAE